MKKELELGVAKVVEQPQLFLPIFWVAKELKCVMFGLTQDDCECES